jgi:hypothetical protein
MIGGVPFTRAWTDGDAKETVMTDDAKQAWNDVGERFASLGKRLSERYREAGPSGEADARETQRKLEDAAKEVGDQVTRALDALGATIRDEAAKADLKQALNAVGEALGATFDEAAEAIRRTVRSKDEGAPPPTREGDDEPGSPPVTG